MELRVLNYFLAIAREENFTKAAQQLQQGSAVEIAEHTVTSYV